MTYLSTMSRGWFLHCQVRGVVSCAHAASPCASPSICIFVNKGDTLPYNVITLQLMGATKTAPSDIGDKICEPWEGPTVCICWNKWSLVYMCSGYGSPQAWSEPTHGAWCLRSVLLNTVFTSTQVQVITKCLCDDLWVGVRCETHRFVRILGATQSQDVLA